MSEAVDGSAESAAGLSGDTVAECDAEVERFLKKGTFDKSREGS